MASMRCRMVEKLVEDYILALRRCNAAATGYARAVRSGATDSIEASVRRLEDRVRLVYDARQVLGTHVRKHGCWRTDYRH
jgi:hypothetical protein